MKFKLKLKIKKLFKLPKPQIFASVVVIKY